MLGGRPRLGKGEVSWHQVLVHMPAIPCCHPIQQQTRLAIAARPHGVQYGVKAGRPPYYTTAKPQ